jgi:hypothetical protein
MVAVFLLRTHERAPGEGEGRANHVALTSNKMPETSLEERPCSFSPVRKQEAKGSKPKKIRQRIGDQPHDFERF